jgi:uncharacterized protein YdbL (DUF1318 family)
MRVRAATSIALVAGLSACRGVPVNLATPRPLEVDVTLRVDIHQHRVEAAGQVQTAAPAEEADTADEEIRRRARMREIQEFKNSRLVGENRKGLLSIVELPPGEYGKRVEQTVAAENADRTALMRAEAKARRVPLATIEAEQAAQWRERAFPGEWIEERQPDGTWRWVQTRAEVPPPAAVETPAAGPR